MHHRECRRCEPCGGGGGVGWRIFKFGCFETLFSALVMRCVSEKPTSSVKRQVFSVLTSAYFRGPVYLKHTVYPRTSTLNISQYCMMFGYLSYKGCLQFDFRS